MQVIGPNDAVTQPIPKPENRSLSKILRFHRSERHLHWSIAIPFMVCYATALILVVVYNPDPQRPLRAVFSWIHRLSGICLIVLPLWTLLRNRADYRVHIDNIRQAWIWAWNDIKWLALSGLAAISSKVELPEQGKFNAAEKLNFMMVMSTYPAFILTGVLIWLPGIAFYSWMLHFVMALIVTPLLMGHVFMATVNPSTRVGLSGMISGYVERKWARHHYGRWYRENFTEPNGVPDKALKEHGPHIGNASASVRCPGCGVSHLLTSWSGELCELLLADPLQCPDCEAEMGVVTLMTVPHDVDTILRQLEALPRAGLVDEPVATEGPVEWLDVKPGTS
jgi:formate dehydrogenase subunit gamma